MAKLKQRPQNFAQNFAILTQKRQISYLDSDDGDITDDETIASPLKPPKKHKLDEDHQRAGHKSSGHLPVQAPREESTAVSTTETADEATDKITEATREDTSCDSEDDITPILRPRHTSAPPALGLPMKGRKAQTQRNHVPRVTEQVVNHEALSDREGSNSLTPPSENVETSTSAVVPKQEPLSDQVAAPVETLTPAVKNEALPESISDLILAAPFADGVLDFQVFDGRKKPHQAYLVKYVKESVNKAGQAWQVAKKHTSIKNKAGIDFKLNDIVNVCFEPSQLEGTAKILEIREKSGIFVLCQWLYTRAEAVHAGATKKGIKSWPPGVHMLSNHYQVLGDENLDSISDVNVDERTYWNAAGEKDLRPLSEITTKGSGRKVK